LHTTNGCCRLLEEAEQSAETELPKEASQPKPTELLDDASQSKEADQPKDEVAPDAMPETDPVGRPAGHPIPPKMPLFKGASEFAMRFTKVLGISGAYSRKRSGSIGFDFDTRRDSATETDMRYDFPKF